MTKFKLNEKMEREFKGIWIPANLYLREDLSWTEKILLLEIDSLNKNDEGCYASNEYLGGFVGKSAETISKIIAKLKGLNLIKEVGFDGRKRRLIVISAPYKTTRQESRKLLHSNNSIVKVSKDTRGESKKQDSLLKRSFGNRCVKVWNEFPFTVTHRSPTIVKTIDLFMKELIQGTFLENKSISKEYFKRHRISLNGKQYTKKQLLQGIRNVALYSKQGYPDIRTKDLSSLIYNDRTGTSIFLSVLASPPKPLREERPIHDDNPRLTVVFISEFKDINSNNKVRLIEGIKSLVEYQGKIKLRIPKMKRLFGTPHKLCNTYLGWLKEQEEWIDEIQIGMIRVGGMMFKRFVKEQEEDCFGYKLVPERREEYKKIRIEDRRKENDK